VFGGYAADMPSRVQQIVLSSTLLSCACFVHKPPAGIEQLKTTSPTQLIVSKIEAPQSSKLSVWRAFERASEKLDLQLLSSQAQEQQPNQVVLRVEVLETDLYHEFGPFTVWPTAAIVPIRFFVQLPGRDAELDWTYEGYYSNQDENAFDQQVIDKAINHAVDRFTRDAWEKGT